MPIRDEDLDRVQRGQRASTIQAVLTPALIERERKILTVAIAKWRGGQLTGDDAKAAIAAIAELRALQDDLTREVRQAQEARSRLAGAPRPGTA